MQRDGPEDSEDGNEEGLSHSGKCLWKHKGVCNEQEPEISLLLVILKVTRSEDSERTRNESQMEENESEREEGKTAGDISNLKLQQRRAV